MSMSEGTGLFSSCSFRAVLFSAMAMAGGGWGSSLRCQACGCQVREVWLYSD